MDKKIKTAFDTLRKADSFALGPINEDGARSAKEKAFDLLLEQFEAVDLFQDLLTHGTTEGKMYAFYGLMKSNEKVFKQATKKYMFQQKKKMKVNVMNGKNMTVTTDSAFIRKLEADAKED